MYVDDDTSTDTTEDTTDDTYGDDTTDSGASDDSLEVENDENGDPVAAAEYDAETGEWTASDVEDLPPATGDGADDADGSSTDSSDTTDADDTTETSTDGESITVDMEEDVDAGPATYDTDNDGTNDTAVVTDADGTTYAFTDVDGDGVADQAVVIEADGDVTVAEHTGEDEWTTTETGEINAEGEYVPDDSTSSSASSDAVWADR